MLIHDGLLNCWQQLRIAKMLKIEDRRDSIHIKPYNTSKMQEATQILRLPFLNAHNLICYSSHNMVHWFSGYTYKLEMNRKVGCQLCPTDVGPLGLNSRACSFHSHGCLQEVAGYAAHRSYQGLHTWDALVSKACVSKARYRYIYGAPKLIIKLWPFLDLILTYYAYGWRGCLS